ncbi:hypothetical protein J2Z21_000181 [Streptomyces griseochromogenes]|uniref:Uncharacterized protein n=1 Tax=Streptomyces griseochromogenes TaxID=68214 RepID=A0ABS4LIP2_9ACTN|nr:hypothetical protein [Streptomyces griseochromogenes]MBP2047259.1 hypothetical protein [Streptomyces griseochromogenes]
MTVEPMRAEEWTLHLVMGRENEPDDLAAVPDATNDQPGGPDAGERTR